MPGQIENELLDLQTIFQNDILIDYIYRKRPLIEFLNTQHQKFHSIVFNGDRSILKKLLYSYNKSIDAPEQVFANIEQIEKEKVKFVVTGQQPGFLTGPLYTIYKAMSAVVCAENYSSDKMHLIPVFWNASEDHDVEEVNHFFFFDKENKILPIIIVDETTKGKCLENLELDKKRIQMQLRVLQESLPSTDFTNDIFTNAIYNELDKAKYWGEFFSRIMKQLFEKWGLILVEPKIFRPYLKDFFEKVITKSVFYNNIFLNTTEKLQTLGYKPSMHKKEEIVGLFYVDDENQRNNIILKDNQYEISNGMVFTKEEILNEVKGHPERFSTNAIFRPMAQDLMMPTYIYVCGPSELTYHIQIKDIYSEFGIKQPNLLFRYGATLIESHVDKIIQKYHFKIIELLNINSLIKKLLQNENKDLFNKQFNKITVVLDELNNELDSQNKELGKRVLYKKQNILKELNEIENMYLKYVKEHNELLLSQINKAKNYLFPNNELQERVFNIFQYLNKYSFKILDGIKDKLMKNNPGSHVVLKCWTF